MNPRIALGRGRLVCASLVLLVAQAHGALPGLTAIDDDSLSEVTGEGIAIALQDFRLATDPHSFIEAIGTEPPSGMPFKRGNGRWYGLSITGMGAGTAWDGSACAATGGLRCPIGTAGVPWLAAYDNPLVMRVFNYNRITNDGTAKDWTVFEQLVPTTHDPFRQAFWGEIEAWNDNGTPGNTADDTVAGVLQSQSIMANVSIGGTRVRLFQTTPDEDANTTTDREYTLGLAADWSLKGNFRFSVAQAAGSANAVGVPPRFEDQEGLHFKNVDTFLPLGQLHYQALILNDTASHDGNFVLELTAIPDKAAIYNDFYALNSGDSTGYVTARAAITGGAVNPRYHETHGHVRWGAWDQGNPNGANATDDGIYFSSYAGGSIVPQAHAGGNEVYDYDNNPTGWYARPVYSDDSRSTQDYGRYQYNAIGASYGSSINLGDSRIEGLLLNHLRITSCSAGPSSPCT